MASTKNSNDSEAQEQQAPNTPRKATREEILQAMLVVARETNLVPTALGPTASGKTYGFNHMAPENNAELITLLLGQHTPDEITGFQVNIGGELKIQMPYWFQEAQNVLDSGKSVWILFDELGLAREETRGALYTFMRDRKLHGHELKPQPGQEVLVFAASNPATFAPPFKTRCLFFGIPSDRNYLSSIAKGNDFAMKAVKLAPIENNKDPFYSNEPPQAPEVLQAAATKALVDLTKSKNFWDLPEPARYEVLSGLVPHQTLVQMLKENVMDPVHLARNWEELLRALRALPRDKKHSMISNVLETFPQLTINERAEAILSILDALYDDVTSDDLQTYFSTTHSEAVTEACSEIDPDYFDKRIKERGLMWVETKGGQNVAKGTFVDRLEKMVEYSQKNPTPTP